MQWPWPKSEAPISPPQAEASPVSAESVRREMEKILAASEFANAVRLREFLCFVVLFDHDQKYGLDVPAAFRALQITDMQTSIQSPWQNGVAERRVGSCRRDLLDHIIALNDAI